VTKVTFVGIGLAFREDGERSDKGCHGMDSGDFRLGINGRA